jgi:hypothetical protein
MPFIDEDTCLRIFTGFLRVYNPDDRIEDKLIVNFRDAKSFGLEVYELILLEAQEKLQDVLRMVKTFLGSLKVDKEVPEAKESKQNSGRTFCNPDLVFRMTSRERMSSLVFGDPKVG